eukprot:TRINITY_DN9805_c0_g1_i1.p1 TRINITY_DN9805_c0_g1~~TRINITY_DN9805_c0_g1_i1.p1  ORF type:complete len:252 (+),score=36.69 TRINITY_DN9805_c0_g1_i1:253-1008(+)
MEGESKPKKFCVLIAGPVVEELQVKFGHYGDMFEKLLRQGIDESWKFYFCMEGDIPSDAELSTYDAMIVTGSKHDAHADHPWLNILKARLAAAYKRKQKILAICFGHQLMAIVLGGKSGRASVGWELGSIAVEINTEFSQTWYGKMLNVVENKSIRITQVHQDQVSDLPPEATVLASSKKTKFEMYSVGDTVLCIQGHPEFEIDFTKQVLELKKGDIFPDQMVPVAISTLQEHPPNQQFLKQICQTFVHGS